MQNKVVALVGARPQFVKEALINAAARQAGYWHHVLVHSGQHYDVNMSDVFFHELGIPAPDYHLGIGSGTHAQMTAAALVGVEKVLMQEKPDALLVYGDTNTTLAGALVAAKLHIPVVHVEAGIRQNPKDMPEEINRVMTDHLSRVFCCCSDLAVKNLQQEGLSAGVRMTGDVMYDQFIHLSHSLRPEQVCAQFGLKREKYVVVTLHRDFNVDDKDALRALLQGLAAIRQRYGFIVFFPLHPRTRKRIAEFHLGGFLHSCVVVDPIGYIELMSLVVDAAFVVTDSGGLQKEAYYAGKRTIVVMPDTGWRELIEQGWNVLTSPQLPVFLHALEDVMRPASYMKNIYGDGHAAHQIVETIQQELF